MVLSIDLQQYLLKYLQLTDQINICNLTSYHREYIKIKDLSKINGTKITQNVIDQIKFNNLEKLNVTGSTIILNLNNLKDTLKELICSQDQMQVSLNYLDTKKTTIKTGKLIEITENHIIPFQGLIQKLKDIDDDIFWCIKCMNGEH